MSRLGCDEEQELEAPALIGWEHLDLDQVPLGVLSEDSDEPLDRPRREDGVWTDRDYVCNLGSEELGKRPTITRALVDLRHQCAKGKQ